MSRSYLALASRLSSPYPRSQAVLALRASIVAFQHSPLQREPVPCVGCTARWLSSSAPSSEPLAVLGLPEGASRQSIKMRYYELAKLTHPDSRAEDEQEDSDLPSFLEVISAFEELMELDSSSLQGKPSQSAPNHAARGGGGASHHARGKYEGGRRRREKTLGEVLVEQLEEEPLAIEKVWADIKSGRLTVHGTMLDALFRACGRVHKEAGGGLPAALAILRDGTLCVLSAHGTLLNVSTAPVPPPAAGRVCLLHKCVRQVSSP